MAEPYKPPYVGSITRHWDESNIDNYYEYPAGFAASRFFHELKENGRIVASVCKACGCKTLPPKAFCPRCFKSDVDYVDVGLRGVVYTFTVSYVDLDGSRLEKPIIWALIVFDGVEGGMIHRLDEVDPESVQVGMTVEAVLRPKEDRIGSILDIKYFKPL
ncbi:MAG: Zn-ribbon domain-containing OB-fold protein [Candidatus Freyarchaeota archaeon]|nr:Zn-ribbon domain-containing OB-fold protein [Candidatus Freyrarchaeum guaymaensis]